MRRGYTIFDLLMVIAIIGIFAAITLAMLRNSQDKARIKAERTGCNVTCQKYIKVQ